MHDIHWIRKNPREFDTAMANRGADGTSQAILYLDEKRRKIQTELQGYQELRNTTSKSIGKAIADRDKLQVEALKQEVSAIKHSIQNLESQEKIIVTELNDYLSSLPNILDSDVPIGPDDSHNVELRNWGGIPKFDFDIKQHFDIGINLGMMDFEESSRISGSRFVILSGLLARLERALGNFMLDIHINEYSYTEISPPLMVREDAAFGTGNLPKFSEDLFLTNSNHILIPTAEMPLTNLVGSQIIDNLDNPIRYVAYTPCFRAEAGAAGKDTRGMIRQHQFNKVELVSITKPHDSTNEHERMTNCAESILQRLELPYRVMLLATGDIGFSARKTYDLEVWLPGQETYREISSCSNCGDFQSRRMGAKYRRKGIKESEFVHTLNGSGIAVGRALVAILENYQLPDGRVKIPSVLIPYMGGQEIIG